MTRALPLLALMALTACDGADYPALVPVAALRAPPTLPDAPPPDQAAADLNARASALAARAAALRRPVIEPATRAAMTQGQS